MTIAPTRPLGRTGLQVPTFGLGTCPLGGLFDVIDTNTADAAFDAAWCAGVRFYDTAPWYGRGLAELHVGHLLRGKPRDSYVLSTKVGRRFFRPADRRSFSPAPWVGGIGFDHVHDYSYDGILRSYEDSLLRLGINSVDTLVIHDLDRGYFKDEAQLREQFRQLEKGGFRALDELKSSGEIRAVGAGINECGMIDLFLDRYPLDFFLVASRYTLLEQEIYDELLRCSRSNVGIVIGGVFNSGILATGPTEGARYEYTAARPETLERVRRIDAVCRRHGVPLAAAALQFPFGLEIVASVIPGTVTPAEIERNLALFQHPVPADLWRELRHERLLRPDVPFPDARATAHHGLRAPGIAAVFPPPIPSLALEP
ncbi:MAG: aldo/keto reductase [Propionivibrio sp.]